MEMELKGKITALAAKAGIEKFDAVFLVKEKFQLAIADDGEEPIHPTSNWREAPVVFKIEPGLYGVWGLGLDAHGGPQDIEIVGERGNSAPSLTLEDLEALEEGGVLDIIQQP